MGCAVCRNAESILLKVLSAFIKQEFIEKIVGKSLTEETKIRFVVLLVTVNSGN